MGQIALLSAALVFGGMTLFSFGFAAVLFKVYGPEEARRGIRGAFPYYYLFVVLGAAVTAAVCLATDAVAAALFAAIALTTIYARQVLMPRINAATDAGDKGAFGRLHGVSVVLQLIQIGLAAWALLRVA